LLQIVESGTTDILTRRSFEVPDETLERVAEIVAAVKERGDEALVDFTARFDGVSLQPGELRVTQAEVETAYRLVEQDFLDALRVAKERILAFHRRQLPASWFDAVDDTFSGQLVRPLERVGIYVPGGTATYPSSVLMNAVPASVAGVAQIVMVTPPGRNGAINPHTLVAAAEAGVTEIYRVGGAQAVAALAFGTATIRKVDKITGPGNIYVTVAKKLVFGQVGIDMLAGPSEVVVIADRNADPDLVAADLLAQAEHDVLARAILITTSWKLAAKVRDRLAVLVEAMDRREVLEKALKEGALAVVAKDLDEAIALANRFAPEHLELMVEDPYTLLGKVRHAGAVFLGDYTPVALGDYAAGPNHVLPTGGTARFFSGLGVETFLKRINVFSAGRGAFQGLAGCVSRLAEIEGLPAHAWAVNVRREGAED